MLSLFTALTGSAVKGAIWFTTVLLFILLIVLRHLSKELFNGTFWGHFLFFAITTNPLLLSCIGMETLPFVVLWVASLSLFVFQRLYLLALCLGLLTLARPDGSLLFMILAIPVLIKPAPIKTKVSFLGIYATAVIPWHLFSWLHLGSFVPDTFIIKTSQGSWGRNISFSTGIWDLYLERYPFAIGFSLLLLPFVFFAFSRTSRRVFRLSTISAAFAVIHYLAYAAIKVPPYHWYYAPFVLGIVVAGSTGVIFISQRFRRIRFVCYGIPLANVIAIIAMNGFPVREAPIHSNWATHEQYKTAGEWIRQNTKPHDIFLMQGEIGTLAYYSDRALLNNFSDANQLQRMIQRRLDKSGGLRRKLYEWNFQWRKPPQPYDRAELVVQHLPYPHPLRSNRYVLQSWTTSNNWIKEGRLYVRSRIRR
jgi:hypothetical protein